MTYTQLLTASETLYGPFVIRKTLLTQKSQALQDGVLLPDDFIAAVERYAERNIIISEIGKTKKLQKNICQSCLKAFMMRAADEHGLTEEAKALLEELFKAESLGHDGYYLDKDEIRKALP